MVTSGTYACQFVLVVNEAAVLNARSGATAASFCGLSGRWFCTRSIRYVRAKVTPLKMSMAAPYSVQRISWVSSTPVSRYTSFSIGRSTGSRNVFSRLNTRVMNAPSGLVSANTTTRKNKIWSQPFVVMVRTSPDAASRTRDRQASLRNPPVKQSYRAFPLPQSVTEFYVQHPRRKKDQRRDGKDCV